MSTSHSLRRIAFLGNHTPRHCGIATFTADLSGAVQSACPGLDCIVVAMNDVGKRYPYPEQVRYQIPEESLASYGKAADYLNVSAVDVVCVQHEYGIFGGRQGAHLLTFMRRLQVPAVTTLHTVIPSPSRSQRAVLEEVCALSERIVVMSTDAADLLRRVHGIPSSKVQEIHHGVPVLPDWAESKKLLGLDGKRVLLTFGLLSPDKGIEYVIDALASIRERFPDVLYLVLGATHPHVKEQHGESYRLMLEARGHALGLDENLRFHDRYVSDGELLRFLAAADISVTPYVNPEQSSSGTLAYAVGAGKAVISSPYRYAQEILADGRGQLVAPRDSDSLAREISRLFGDDVAKAELQRRALAFGENMHWPIVAKAYLDCFDRAFTSYGPGNSSLSTSPRQTREFRALPEISLAHLQTMTDDTGLLQHAKHAIPRYEDGYCLDDNARALVVMTNLEEARGATPGRIRDLCTRYLAFVRYAFDERTGLFRNFMNYGRQWTESRGSEDSHARALWALGVVGARTDDLSRRAVAMELFEDALPAVESFTSPRAWGYTLLGVAEYVQARGTDGLVPQLGRKLAERLVAQHRSYSKPDWPWFEDSLTYANARLPQALMLTAGWTNDEATLATALHSLEWLTTIQTSPAGWFSPVGSPGFFQRSGTKASFDQQPIEACGSVAACLQAHRMTGDGLWRTRALLAFNWFLGQNTLQEWLYDPGTGGCRDGLHPDRVNENQGAESTLSFLMALLDMRDSDRHDLETVATRTLAGSTANTSRETHASEVVS